MPHARSRRLFHRRASLRLLFVTLLSLTLAACDSGGDDDGDSSGDLAGSFRVDGTLYTTENAPPGSQLMVTRQDVAVGSRTVTILSGGLSSLSGNTVHAILFVVTGVDAPGTYSIDPFVEPEESSEPGGGVSYLACDVEAQSCDEDAGNAATYSSMSDWTLTISEIDDERLAGSFEFVGVNDDDSDDTVVIEGQFNLPLTSF